MEPAWSGPHAPGHFSALQGWQGLVREPPVGAHILHIYEDPDREIEAAPLFAIEGARRAERVSCVARLFENGRFDRALAFEQLCHERREVLPWSLLCAYDGRKLSPERHAAAFWDVLRNHSHLIPAGELGVALELCPAGVHE